LTTRTSHSPMVWIGMSSVVSTASWHDSSIDRMLQCFWKWFTHDNQTRNFAFTSARYNKLYCQSNYIGRKSKVMCVQHAFSQEILWHHPLQQVTKVHETDKNLRCNFNFEQ
jgi:hypothetical protein